jgi:hypothetical protein
LQVFGRPYLAPAVTRNILGSPIHRKSRIGKEYGKRPTTGSPLTASAVEQGIRGML